MERTQDAHLPRHRRALRCHATAAQRAYRRRRRHAAPRAVGMAALDVRSGCGSRGRDRGRGSLAGRCALAGSRAVPVLCQPYRRRDRPASGGRDAGVAARRHRVALCRRQGGRGADRAARRRGLFRRVARCAASLRRGDPRAGDPGAGHGLQCPGARRRPAHGGGARTRRRTPRNPRRRQPRAAASQPAGRVRRPDGRHGGGRNQRAALCDQALQPGHDEGRHDHGDHRRHRKELRRTHTHHVARRRQTLRHQLPAEQFARGGRRHRRVHDRNALRGDPQRMIRGLRPTTAGLLHRTTRNTLHEP